METFGNIGGLKAAIEKKYSSRIRTLEKEKEHALKEIEKEVLKKLGELKPKMLLQKETESKRKYSTILTEEKMKAVKSFQEKREELINKVFSEAKKRAKHMVHTEKYAAYVKKNMPSGEDMQMYGDDVYYQKFFPEIKIDKALNGIVCKSRDVIYDFTLDHLMESKKESLRYEVSKILFG
jgi:vacuolar-type H+-ATPase subunit E/Vma4